MFRVCVNVLAIAARASEALAVVVAAATERQAASGSTTKNAVADL